MEDGLVGLGPGLLAYLWTCVLRPGTREKMQHSQLTRQAAWQLGLHGDGADVDLITPLYGIR